MAKPEWGVKRVCPTTGKRFYDMNRDPVISPYTGEVVDIAGEKSVRTMVADKADKAGKPELATEADEVLVEDDAVDVELGDDVLEDEDDDSVSLDELADVAADDDES